jgi:hypothetical protein
MPRVRSPRRVLSITMGIAAIFDLTGTTVYRRMMELMPPAPPNEDPADPFQAAMATIISANREVTAMGRDQAPVTERSPATDQGAIDQGAIEQDAIEQDEPGSREDRTREAARDSAARRLVGETATVMTSEPTTALASETAGRRGGTALPGA